MTGRLNVLILEDNPADAELIKRELRKTGLDFTARVAQDKGELLSELENFSPGLLLTDYSLPGFSALGALAMARGRFPALPVIVVSGAIGEEMAIETLKAGATDYVLKQRLARLGPVVHRALEEAALLAEKNKAEEALRGSERMLRALVENTPDAVLLTAPDGRVLDANPAACSLFGLARGEFGLFGVAPSADPAALAGVLEELARTGKARRELTFQGPGGAPIHTDLSAVGVETPEGHRSFVILRDIAARKNADAVLKRDKETLDELVKERTEALMKARLDLEKARSLADIGLLAATVAHELRNPLAAIGMAAANIKRKVPGPLLEKNLLNIDKKVAESNQIINNLLFYSRLKAPVLEKVELTALLDEAIDFVKGRCENVDVVKEAAPLPVKVDPSQMKEVFLNLLNNACDALAGAPDGKILVSAAAEDGAIKVRVENNGPEIDKEHLPRIFMPFFTTKAKGTGLGLYICRQILNMHNGDITVESRPGATAFSITLP